MKRTLTAFFLVATAMYAQSWKPPADSDRCPSKWGPGDQRGSGNLMKPETVLRATKLIRTGEVFELGHVLTPAGPFFGTRHLDITLKRTVLNPGTNRRGSNEEMVSTELGQIGTQFDGFAHQTIGDSLYNCFKLDEISTRVGFTKLGVENAGFLMTRGVVIDIAALKGVDLVPDGYEITADDLQKALARQKMTLEPGDAAFVNTGWSTLWGKDNPRYLSRAPGIDAGAAEWLASKNPMIVGSDNASVEISPNPDKTISLPVHQIMLVVHGIHLLENMNLDEMVAKRVYEFAFMIQPLKLQGGTGSTVAPVGIR